MLSEDNMVTGMLKVFGDTFKPMLRILGVGIKEVFGKTYHNFKVWGEHIRVWRVRNLGVQNMALLLKKADQITPEQERYFQEAFRKASKDAYESLRDAHQNREKFRQEIKTRYEQIMRPTYDEVLQGPHSLGIFLANPPLYLGALGVRVFTDQVPLGSFANKDVAGVVDLLAPTLRQSTEDQARILMALKREFRADRIIESEVEEKTTALFEADGSTSRLKDQLSKMNEKQLQSMLEQAGIFTWEDMFKAIFEHNPDLAGSVVTARAFIEAQRETFLETAEEAGQDIKLCLALIEAQGVDEFQTIIEQAGEDKGMFEELSRFVVETLSNPEKAAEIIEELELRESDPETVGKALRSHLFSGMKEKIDKDLQIIIATLERGVLTCVADSMPVPGDEDWELLNGSKEGKAFRQAVEEYISLSNTLR